MTSQASATARPAASVPAATELEHDLDALAQEALESHAVSFPVKANVSRPSDSIQLDLARKSLPYWESCLCVCEAAQSHMRQRTTREDFDVAFLSPSGR